MLGCIINETVYYCQVWFLLFILPIQSSSRHDETESRYSSQYEERLDPFNSFSRKERQRKYMNLSPFDKATLSMVSYWSVIYWITGSVLDYNKAFMIYTSNSLTQSSLEWQFNFLLSGIHVIQLKHHVQFVLGTENYLIIRNFLLRRFLLTSCHCVM